MKLHRRRGYAMGIVLMVLGLLGIGMLLLAQTLTASVGQTRRAYAEQRLSYACDSAARVAGAVAESVMLGDTEASSAGAMNAVCGVVGPCVGALVDPTCAAGCDYRVGGGDPSAGPGGVMVPDTVLERFSLGVFSSAVPTTVRTGGFRGMLSLRQRLSLSLAGRGTKNNALCRGKNSFTLQSVSPLQLMLTSMVPTDWSSPVPRSPAAGADLRRAGPSAYVDGPLGADNVSLTRVISTASVTGSATVWSGVGAFFESLGGASRVTRVASGEALRLPVAPLTNTGNQARWILDPPYVNDPARVKQLKLSFQADIRIIDGIWFVRPKDTDLVTPQWPGIMVWSDHPGDNVVAGAPLKAIIGNRFVGQKDRIDAALTSPNRYSFYENDAANHMTTDDFESRENIVSYGTLRLHGNETDRSPGAMSTLCTGTPGPSSSPLAYFNCASGKESIGLVDATRTGFKDLDAGENMLPINLDVAGLVRALRDKTPGELGSYFCGASDSGVANVADVPAAGCRKFNGILWIGSTWNGRPTSSATAAFAPVPSQGDATSGTSTFPAAASSSTNRLYTQALCGGSASTLSGFDAAKTFVHMPCNDSQWDGGIGAINAVRLFHLEDLRPFLASFRSGTRGLTIATHLPLYVVGDVNTKQLTDGRKRSVLLAADRVTFLSTTANDEHMPWGAAVVVPQGKAPTVRASVATTTSPGQQAEHAFRILEPFDGNLTIFGSLWILGRPAHHSGPMSTTTTASAPPLQWTFDPFLEDPTASAPGTPRLVIGVHDRWIDAR